MSETAPKAAVGAPSVPPSSPPPRRVVDRHALLYRWFVQYNPLYLISATAVLVGVYLLSDGLVQREGLWAQLAIFGVTELYQLALIGSAALLYRLGQRRPATMLALLTIAYLVDLTLQTSVSAYLGPIGVIVALAWVGLTALKLRLLVWALRLRVSWSIDALALSGAAGLAVLPQLLAARAMSLPLATMVVGWWFFGVAALALWTRPRVASRDALSPWGEKVLRLASSGGLTLSGVLAAGHVLWWTSQFSLMPLLWVVSVVPLLATRFIRREVSVWGTVLAVLALNTVTTPTLFCLVAPLAAVVLTLRGLRGPLERRETEPAPGVAAHPYRLSERPPQPADATYIAPSPLRPEAKRLYLGALGCVYLAIWTIGWSGALWLEHTLWLDLVVGALLTLALWRWRWQAWPAALAIGVMVGHLTIQSGRMASNTQLGLVMLIAGFVLLGGGLLLNTLLRRHLPNVRELRAFTDGSPPGERDPRALTN